MTDHPVPAFVKAVFPEVGDRWVWLSPLRLRGEGPQGVVLVAVDRECTDLSGEWRTRADADDPELSARIYGRLRVDLGARIGRRIACEDGTPVRAEHNIRVCAWCGASWDVHDGNGTPGEEL